MKYKILETKIEFIKNRIQRVTVLIDCTSPSSKNFSDVRAIYATINPQGGYMSISPSAKISAKLLQEVAASGIKSSDRDEIFPDWKRKQEEI